MGLEDNPERIAESSDPGGLKDADWASMRSRTGVEGWLALLCFGLIVASPLDWMAAAAWMYLGGGISVTALSFVGLAAFSLYAGVALLRLRPNAVKLAKLYLVCTFVVAVVLALALSLPVDLEAVEAANARTNQAGVLVLRSGAFVLVWYLYLTKSKRVKATYGSQRESMTESGAKGANSQKCPECGIYDLDAKARCYCGYEPEGATTGASRPSPPLKVAVGQTPSEESSLPPHENESRSSSALSGYSQYRPLQKLTDGQQSRIAQDVKALIEEGLLQIPPDPSPDEMETSGPVTVTVPISVTSPTVASMTEMSISKAAGVVEESTTQGPVFPAQNGVPTPTSGQEISLRNDMTPLQRWLFLAGSIFVVAVLLLPPKTCEYSDGSSRQYVSVGHSLIGPHCEYYGPFGQASRFTNTTDSWELTYWSVRVDITRLLLEVAAITIATVAIALFTGGLPKRRDARSE